MDDSALMEDIEKCSEHVQHHRLQQKAKGWKFPVVLLRATVASYRWERCVLYQKMLMLPICPKRGIVAGSSAATPELKLFLADLVHEIRSVHAQVSISIYVDDVNLEAIERSEMRAAENLVEAGIDFVAGVQLEGLETTDDKTPVVATTDTLATRVAKGLGCPRAASTSTCSLGVDFSAGRQLGIQKSGRSIRCKRLTTAKKRMKRVRQVLFKKRRVARVFRTGVMPALQHGNAVTGCSAGSLCWARGVAARCCLGGGQGGNQEITFGLSPEKDPGRKLVLGPLACYAKEVWEATDVLQHRPRTIPHLRRWAQSALDRWSLAADRRNGPIRAVLR